MLPFISAENTRVARTPLELCRILQQHHFLARLERREPGERAICASVGIAEATGIARPSLPLLGEVQLGKVIRLQLESTEILVRFRPPRLVLGLESLG